MSESAARGVMGLANFRFASEEEIQRGIDKAMRDVIAHDSRHNPNGLTRDGLVTVVGAGVVQNGVALAPQPNEPGVTNGVPNNFGWRADVPYGPAGGETAQRLIEQMVNAALPMPRPKARPTLEQIRAAKAELERMEREMTEKAET